jgi:hypothetical protein
MTAQKPTSPHNTANSRPRPGKELVRISVYVLGLVGAYVETERLLPDTWLWLTLPKGEWHPSLVLFNPATLWFPITALLPHVLLLAFLVRFFRCLQTGTLREMRPWLLVRAALLGLSLLFVLSTSEAVQTGQQILDTRATDVLRNLRPDLSQAEVETLILQANLAMLRPPERGSLEGPDHEGGNLYIKTQEALARIGRGERIFEASPMRSTIDIHKRILDCSQEDGTARENADHNRVLLCYRNYMRGSDPQGGASLLVKFDASTRLQSARYRQTRRHADPSCQVIFEIPPAPNKTYPAICSPEDT